MKWQCDFNYPAMKRVREVGIGLIESKTDWISIIMPGKTVIKLPFIVHWPLKNNRNWYILKIATNTFKCFALLPFWWNHFQGSWQWRWSLNCSGVFHAYYSYDNCTHLERWINDMFLVDKASVVPKYSSDYSQAGLNIPHLTFAWIY